MNSPTNTRVTQQQENYAKSQEISKIFQKKNHTNMPKTWTVVNYERLEDEFCKNCNKTFTLRGILV